MAQGVSDAEGMGAVIWIVALVIVAFFAGCSFGATALVDWLSSPKRVKRPTLPLSSVLSRAETRRLELPAVRRNRIPVVLDVD